MRKYLAMTAAFFGLTMIACNDGGSGDGGSTYLNEAVLITQNGTETFELLSGSYFYMGEKNGVTHFEIVLESEHLIDDDGCDTEAEETHISELIYLNLYTDAATPSGTYTFGEGTIGRKLRDGLVDWQHMVTGGSVKVSKKPNGTFIVDFNLTTGSGAMMGNYTGELGQVQKTPVEISGNNVFTSGSLVYLGPNVANPEVHQFNILLNGNNAEYIDLKTFTPSNTFNSRVFRFGTTPASAIFSVASTVSGVNFVSGRVEATVSIVQPQYTIKVAGSGRHGLTVNTQYRGSLEYNDQSGE